jgi:hypothetical protein
MTELQQQITPYLRGMRYGFEQTTGPEYVPAEKSTKKEVQKHVTLFIAKEEILQINNVANCFNK